MDNFAFCSEMKEYMKNFFSETLHQINLIIEQRTKELELYLDDAAKKFEKRRKLKKPAVATEVDDEQKSLKLNKKERPSRTATKVASQKLKDDAQMTAKKKLRHVAYKKGNAVLQNLKLGRISDESDEFDKLFDNSNRDIDKIVQSPSASSQIPRTSSLVVENTDISTDSSSSGASPQPMRVTRTKRRAVAKSATLYSNTQNNGNQPSREEKMRLLKERLRRQVKMQMEERKRIKEARKLRFRKRCEEMEFECQEHLRKLEEAETLKKLKEMELLFDDGLE